MTPTPASPPVDDRAEMEALLRTFGQAGSEYWAKSDMMTGILAHLRAEKAKARKDGFHAGREDMAKEGWPICELEEAEAAALRGASDFLTEENEHRAADLVAALISPASISALAERDARMRGEGRKEGLRQAIAAVCRMSDVCCHLFNCDVEQEIDNLIDGPSQPAQGAKEQGNG